MNAESSETGIARAVKAAGSQGALAVALGVSQQSVSKWEARGYAPVRRVVEIEQFTGVARGELIDPKLVDLLDLSGI